MKLIKINNKGNQIILSVKNISFLELKEAQLTIYFSNNQFITITGDDAKSIASAITECMEKEE